MSLKKVTSFNCRTISRSDINLNAESLIKKLVQSYHEDSLSEITRESIRYRMNLIIEDIIENDQDINKNALYLGGFMALNSLYEIVDNTTDSVDALSLLSSLEEDSNEFNEFLSREFQDAQEYNKQGGTRDQINNQDKNNLSLKPLFNFIQYDIDGLMFDTSDGFEQPDINKLPIEPSEETSPINPTRVINSFKEEGISEIKSDLESSLIVEEVEIENELDQEISEDELKELQENIKIKNRFNVVEFPTQLNNENIDLFVKFLVENDTIATVTSIKPFETQLEVTVSNGIDREYNIQITKEVSNDTLKYTYKILSGTDNYIPTSGNLNELTQYIGTAGSQYQYKKITPTTELTQEEFISRNSVRQLEGQGVAYSNTLPLDMSQTSLFSIKGKDSRNLLKVKNYILGELLNTKSETFTLDSSFLKKLVKNSFSKVVGRRKSNQLDIIDNLDIKLEIKADDINYPQDPLVSYSVSSNTVEYAVTRLALYITYDSNDTLDSLNLPKEIKLANLNIPIENDTLYAQEYHNLQKGVLSNTSIDATGLSLNPNDIYQPSQLYNSTEQEIKQYRLHLNEQYRIGNFDYELSNEELTEVASNLVLMKSLGYDIPVTTNDVIERTGKDINEISLTDIGVVSTEILTENKAKSSDNPNNVYTILSAINRNDETILSAFRERLKQPIRIPLFYHNALMRELGFNVRSKVVMAVDDFSGKSVSTYTPGNVPLKEEVNFNNLPSSLSSEFNTGLVTSRPKILSFSDFLEVDLASPDAKRSMLDVVQAPYFYYQTLKAIERIEDIIDNSDLTGAVVTYTNKDYLVLQTDNNNLKLLSSNNKTINVDKDNVEIKHTNNKVSAFKSNRYIITSKDSIVSVKTGKIVFAKEGKNRNSIITNSKELKIKELRNRLKKAKSSLFDISNPYNIGYNDAFLEGKSQKEIQEILLNEFSSSVKELEDTYTEKVNIPLSERVRLYNQETNFRSREKVKTTARVTSKVDVDITTYDSKKIKRKSTYSTFKINRTSGYTNPSFKELYGDISIEVHEIDDVLYLNKEAFSNESKIEPANIVKIKLNEVEKEFVRVRTMWKDSDLFYSWYSIDGKYKYTSVLSPRVDGQGFDVLTLSSIKTDEFINYGEVKYKELIDIVDTQEGLDIINDNVSRLFGSYYDLEFDSDGTIKGRLNKEKEEFKKSFNIINNSPNSFTSSRFGKIKDIDAAQATRKLKMGGIRTKDILDIYNKDLYEKEDILLLDKSSDVGVLFNPAPISQGQKRNNEYKPSLKDTPSFNDRFIENDIYPMFPHMIIDLPRNKDLLLGQVSEVIETITPDEVIDKTKQEEVIISENIVISDDTFEIDLDDDADTLGDFDLLGRSDNVGTTYTGTEEDVITLYQTYLGITPVVVSQTEYDLLSTKEKEDNFYIITSTEKFNLNDSLSYIGLASKGFNALYTENNKYDLTTVKHEILHTILNEYIPNTRRKKILEDTLVLIKNDPNRDSKYDNVDSLSDIDIEEYLVSLKEKAEFGINWRRIKENKIVSTIENSVVGRFIDKVLGKENSITKFLSWLGTTYKKLMSFSDTPNLDKFLLDVSYNRFRGSDRVYNNFNREGKEESLNILGRLNSEVQEKSEEAQKINLSFGSPYEYNQSLRELEGSKRFALYKRQIKDLVIKYKFVNKPIDLFKARKTTSSAVAKVTLDYLKSAAQELKTNRVLNLNNHPDIAPYVANINNFIKKDSISYRELKDNIRNIKSYIEKTFDKQTFESNLERLYFNLTVLENRNEILSFIYDDINFEAWNDSIGLSEGEQEIASSWQQREQTHLSVLDTASKKVKEYLYNTSYKYTNENGQLVKQYVDPSTAQEILNKVFRIAQETKGDNKINNLNQAWKKYLTDQANTPKSFYYLEARAIYDKIFKPSEDFIPVVSESEYTSEYKYSYNQVGFNTEEVLKDNKTSVPGVIKYLQSWDNSFIENIRLNDNTAIKSQIEQLTKSTGSTPSKLNQISKLFTALNLSNDFNSILNNYQSNTDKIEGIRNLVDDINSVLLDYKDINPAITQLHQDVYTSITNLFYSSWKVNFTRAGVTKNVIKVHSDVGYKQEVGYKLSAKTSMINNIYDSNFKLRDNIIDIFISHTVNTTTSTDYLQEISGRPNNSFKLSHDSKSLNINLPFNHKGNNYSVEINLSNDDITKGSYRTINGSKINEIFDQLSNFNIDGNTIDVKSNVLASLYNALGLQVTRNGIRTFFREESYKNQQDILQHALQSYMFIQAVYEEENGIVHSRKRVSTDQVRSASLLYELVKNKDDVDPVNITQQVSAINDTDGTNRQATTFIFSPTRDVDNVITRLIDYNKRFKQEHQKDSVYFGEKRYATQIYTTPLYEHLEALRSIKEEKDLAKIVDVNTKQEKKELLSQYKFMSTPFYQNPLSNVFNFKGGLQTQLEMSDWSIFNYISNSSSGSGKSFLNLSIKELLRQTVNDFFLFPGKSGDKYGNYVSPLGQEYKQTLEAQANRGQLPIIELNQKIFYDYEGIDNVLLNGIYTPISNLGVKAESELFNLHASSKSYLYNVLKEYKEILSYVENSNLEVFIDDNYVNVVESIASDINPTYLDHQNDPIKIFQEYERLQSFYSKNLSSIERDGVVKSGFEWFAIDNINNIIENLNSLPQTPQVRSAITEYTDTINSIENIKTIANTYKSVYSTALQNRLTESFIMYSQYLSSESLNDNQLSKTNKKKIGELNALYKDLISTTKDGIVFDENKREDLLDKVYNKLGYVSDQIETRPSTTNYHRYTRLPNVALDNLFRSTLSKTAFKLNDQLALLSKEEQNQLVGKLTPHRHYDKGDLVSINGKTGYTITQAINRINNLYEKGSNDIKTLLTIKKSLSRSNLSIENLRNIVANEITIHDTKFNSLLDQIRELNPTYITNLNGSVGLLDTFDKITQVLNNNGINEVKSVKSIVLGQLLIGDVNTSFTDYINTVKSEMIRFGKLAANEEVELTGFLRTYKTNKGTSNLPIKHITSNNRYNNILIQESKSYLEDTDKGFQEIVNNDVVTNKYPNLTTNVRFIYRQNDSNASRKSFISPIVQSGSFYYFSNEVRNNNNDIISLEERQEQFNNLTTDGQLKEINPILLDFFLTDKINGFYLGQYIDGDIYRYKGKDTTSKTIDMIKRIGTNTTPGSKPLIREELTIGTNTKVIQDKGLSLYHNASNIPDEVYNAQKKEYKYFIDISALTFDNDQDALASIKENLEYYGNYTKAQIDKLTIDSLNNLKETDSSSKYNKGIYQRVDAKYQIQTNELGDQIISLQEAGKIRGRSGETISSFEAWDGVTFISNLYGMLIINSFGNNEGVDMTAQGLKMINNNLDAKNQNGVAMKSLQVKFSPKFIFDSNDSVKAMVKEGYINGVLNEPFLKLHTYQAGEQAIFNGQSVTLEQDVNINVPSGDWDINGTFIPPTLEITTDERNIKWAGSTRNKTLYDVYWENGGWNPNKNGTYDMVYFNGSLKEGDPNTSTTQVGKADFEVYKAYVKNRNENNFLVKDIKNNNFISVEQLLNEITNDNNIYFDLIGKGITTPLELINELGSNDRYLYMDSVMLFNPKSGIKKGARTSNPNWKGNYTNTFENIHSQKVDNQNYIISLNKKDKLGQSVALSSQFTYLLGSERNVFDVQDVYDIIAELSNEERKDFDLKVQKSKENLISKGAKRNIKDTISNLNKKQGLLEILPEKIVQEILSSRLLSNDSDAIKNSTLTESELDQVVDFYIENTAVKRYMLDIVRRSAESSQDFNQVWEHVSNQDKIEEMSVSNPVLFNKLFSEVAAKISRGMSLKVNGKKAVQMPITQMKAVYVWNDRKYTKTDIYKILKSQYPNYTVGQIDEVLQDLIKEKVVEKRNLQYGNPNDETGEISATEVEASNPYLTRYNFLKDVSLRDMFTVYNGNDAPLDLEAESFDDIERFTDAITSYLEVQFDDLNTETTKNISNSVISQMIEENLNSKIETLQRLKRLQNYQTNDILKDSTLTAEVREDYLQSQLSKLEDLNDKLKTVDENEREALQNKISNLNEFIKEIPSFTDEQIIKKSRETVRFNNFQYNELLNYQEFISNLKVNGITEDNYFVDKFINDFSNQVRLANRSLYGVMSRVPNTGLNSNSFFKITTFNNEYGNSVFIPAEWLDISGSDHDGDTLQLWIFDQTGKNKSSDKALENAKKIMTNNDNTSAIFSKLDLSLKPIQEVANEKYSQPGMYLRPYDAWSFFTTTSQNAVGSTVVGSSALLGKNYTYFNQYVKRVLSFLNIQEDARGINRINQNKLEKENKLELDYIDVDLLKLNYEFNRLKSKFNLSKDEINDIKNQFYTGYYKRFTFDINSNRLLSKQDILNNNESLSTILVAIQESTTIEQTQKEQLIFTVEDLMVNSKENYDYNDSISSGLELFLSTLYRNDIIKYKYNVQNTIDNINTTKEVKDEVRFLYTIDESVTSKDLNGVRDAVKPKIAIANLVKNTQSDYSVEIADLVGGDLDSRGQNVNKWIESLIQSAVDNAKYLALGALDLTLNNADAQSAITFLGLSKEAIMNLLTHPEFSKFFRGYGKYNDVMNVKSVSLKSYLNIYKRKNNLDINPDEKSLKYLNSLVKDGTILREKINSKYVYHLMNTLIEYSNDYSDLNDALKVTYPIKGKTNAQDTQFEAIAGQYGRDIKDINQRLNSLDNGLLKGESIIRQVLPQNLNRLLTPGHVGLSFSHTREMLKSHVKFQEIKQSTHLLYSGLFNNLKGEIYQSLDPVKAKKSNAQGKIVNALYGAINSIYLYESYYSSTTQGNKIYSDILSREDGIFKKVDLKSLDGDITQLQDEYKLYDMSESENFISHAATVVKHIKNQGLDPKRYSFIHSLDVEGQTLKFRGSERMLNDPELISKYKAQFELLPQELKDMLFKYLLVHKSYGLSYSVDSWFGFLPYSMFTRYNQMLYRAEMLPNSLVTPKHYDRLVSRFALENPELIKQFKNTKGTVENSELLYNIATQNFPEVITPMSYNPLTKTSVASLYTEPTIEESKVDVDYFIINTLPIKDIILERSFKAFNLSNTDTIADVTDLRSTFDDSQIKILDNIIDEEIIRFKETSQQTFSTEEDRIQNLLDNSDLIIIEHDGKSMSYKDWKEELNINIIQDNDNPKIENAKEVQSKLEEEIVFLEVSLKSLIEENKKLEFKLNNIIEYTPSKISSLNTYRTFIRYEDVDGQSYKTPVIALYRSFDNDGTLSYRRVYHYNSESLSNSHNVSYDLFAPELNNAMFKSNKENGYLGANWEIVSDTSQKISDVLASSKDKIVESESNIKLEEQNKC